MHSAKVKFSDDAARNQVESVDEPPASKMKPQKHPRRLPPLPSFSYRFIPDIVAWLFGIYGYFLGRHPWPFLIIGLVTGLAAVSGLWKIRLATDSANLIDQFLEVDNRYVSDELLVKNWIRLAENIMKKHKMQAAESNYEELLNSSELVGRRSKRSAINQCDFQKYSATWRHQSVMVVSKSDSILSEEVFADIFQLNLKIRDILSCSLEDFDKYTTRTYCCDSWDLLRIKSEVSKNDPGSTPSPQQMADFFKTLTYPADKRIPNSPSLFANFFGGVKTNDPDNAYNAQIVSVKAIIFQYMLPSTQKSLELEKMLTRDLKNIRRSYRRFDIYWQTYMQLEDEFVNEVLQQSPRIAATFICVVLWCFTGALQSDVLRSKPYLGILGITCTAFACAAGFGVRFWFGDSFYTYLIAVPLMALAIGLDDMFILLSNWHRTDICLPREERAMLTLYEGGTSIFVTAMITIIDFIIGTYTPYSAINTYSNFAIWCLVFDFWLQMTVFTSVLVLTDGCEKDERHSCCCWRKITKRTNDYSMRRRANCYLICCTYGALDQKSTATASPRKSRLVESEQKTQDHAADDAGFYANIVGPPTISKDAERSAEPPSSVEELVVTAAPSSNSSYLTASERLIHDRIAPLILHPISRVVILIGVIGFLAASLSIAWTKIRIGFRPEHLANRLSNTYDFNVYSWMYFRQYSNSQQLQILFNFTTAPFNGDYALIRKQVVEIAERFEQSSQFIWEKRLNHVAIRDIEIDNITDLTLDEAVATVAEREPIALYKPYILNGQTVDERLIFVTTFQTKDLSTLERGAQLTQFLKNVQISYEHGEDFRINIADLEQALRIFDQIINLPKQLVYFALITLGSTVVVSFLMIPHPICIFWLSLSSICVVIGTIAGMVLWDVSLDPVSLVYVLMAIGATADYICHAIYTFTVINPAVSHGPVAAELADIAIIRYSKARMLIAHVVCETAPAVVGTVLSIIALSTTNVYVLEAFFKVFFVSICVASIFMAVVLPVALCQFGPTGNNLCQPESDRRDDQFEQIITKENNSFEDAQQQKSEETARPTIVRSEIVFMNQPEVSAEVTQQILPTVSSRDRPRTHGRQKDFQDSNTWKEKVLHRFLHDSNKYCTTLDDSGALSLEDINEQALYVNVKNLIAHGSRKVTKSTSRRHLRDERGGPKTVAATPIVMSDGYSEGHAANRTTSQAQHSNEEHFRRFVSSRHTFQENSKRNGVRHGVLNI